MLHRHGFARGDDQHAGRAIVLIGDLARIYEGSRETHPGPASRPQPPSRNPTGPSVPEADLDAVTLTHAEVSTVLTALDIAADWKRDRAEMCADCADQSCFACQLRLREARTYDQLADRCSRTRRTAPAATPPGRAPLRPVSPGLAADKEAGQ